MYILSIGQERLNNDAFWVNLRPDGEDNIIDPDLAKTDLGRVMLEADPP